MPTLLILMVCGCLAVWWWSAARAAAEALPAATQFSPQRLL